MGRPEGSAALALVGAATPLHPAPALFEEMINGWGIQHAARRLSPALIRSRERTVRRFQEFCGSWPWEWSSEQLESWIAQGRWAPSAGWVPSVATGIATPLNSSGNNDREP